MKVDLDQNGSATCAVCPKLLILELQHNVFVILGITSIVMIPYLSPPIHLYSLPAAVQLTVLTQLPWLHEVHNCQTKISGSATNSL